MTHTTCRVALPCPHVTEHYIEHPEREKIGHWQSQTHPCTFSVNGPLLTLLLRPPTLVPSLPAPFSFHPPAISLRNCLLGSHCTPPIQPLLVIFTVTCSGLAYCSGFFSWDPAHNVDILYPSPSLLYHKPWPLQIKDQAILSSDFLIHSESCPKSSSWPGRKATSLTQLLSLSTHCTLAKLGLQMFLEYAQNSLLRIFAPAVPFPLQHRCPLDALPHFIQVFAQYTIWPSLSTLSGSTSQLSLCPYSP